MILVVDMNWKKDSLGYYEFVLPILAVAEKQEQCSVKHYSELTSQDLEECSRVILSGTTLKDNATLAEPEKFGWLKTAEKPVLGICAGMQTLGVVFGLVLPKCLEIGMKEMITLRDNPLFSGSFRAYSLHNFSVDASEDFEVLAESATCFQAVKHKKKPLFGVLFHPEVRNEGILKNFIAMKT